MGGMDSERPPFATVEAVREELKRLGYLDSSLDRFVLAGGESTSPLRASLGVALRVGVLGGALFGLAATLAAVGLDRRLLAEPRDILVLGAYLAALLGLATALAALVGGLAAAWVGRRLGRRPRPSLARNIGIGLALGGLAYFALWWRSHLGAAPPAVHAIALALAVGLALVLGRFGWQAAVAVLAAGGVGDRLPVASLSRRNVIPLLATAALLVGSGVAAATWLRPDVPADAPDFAVVPTGVRVRVLAVDGLERRMTEQMLERGDMPHLQVLLRDGAHGRLRAEPERVPAIVWTTIATGRGPEVHGIRSTGARRIPGLRTRLDAEDDAGRFAAALSQATELLGLVRREPPTSLLRGAKTFWNVASEKGLRVGIVNWWATWPADAVNGYVVTDRALFKLEKGGPPDREVFPTRDFERLRALVPDAREDRAQALDRFHVAAAKLLRGTSPPDVEAVYLPGLDIFTMQRLADTTGADLATLDARLGAVREEFRLVDGLLGELVAAGTPDDLLVIVGDPGRLARATGEEPEGLVVLSGPGVQGGDLGLVSSRDIAPTVLHLAGLPASAELDGRVLEAAFSPGFLASHPVRRVASYGRRPPGRAAESAFDRDVLEELRSLGYIK
jgi:hypothetical protein